MSADPQINPLRYFSDHLKDIEGLGIHQNIAEHGTSDYILGSLGHAEYISFKYSEAIEFELPAYGSGFGVGEQGHWWQKDSFPLHVSDWVSWAGKRRPSELPGVKFEHWSRPDNLSVAGPSLAIRDTTFGVAVLVDGCHRALIRTLLGHPVPVVLYESPYAHMLIFPSHFVNHAIAKSSGPPCPR